MTLPPEIDAFYSAYEEQGRLDRAYFQLERERTREVVSRHAPPPPASVLDVGGGPGAYALWLAAKGYRVHLIDPVPLHVAQAGQASKAQAPHGLASARVGDARALEHEDASVDFVLLLGPLYHLTQREERVAALREARRVLRQDGFVFAAAISRAASLVDGLRGAVFRDPDFERIVRADLFDGQHRNDTGRIEYFTTAFFHRPEELAQEIQASELRLVELVALEGLGAVLPDFEARWRDPGTRATLMSLLRLVEAEPSLLGVSPHLLAVAQK